MSSPITEIVLPTRPQADTIVSIFLLKKFGTATYPGIETAKVVVDPKATDTPGKVLVDVGGGVFDHHGTDKCATELVAEALGVRKNQELKMMINYAIRDDKEGKGTLSTDSIDRAFGLSGLIASLKKQFPNDADTVTTTVLPLLEAQYQNAYEHYVGLPKLVKELEQMSLFTSTVIKGELPKLKIAFFTSDHIGIPSFLRSAQGGDYKVVVQRRTSGHVNIITKQKPKKLDLSQTAALLRLREADLRGVTVEDESSLFETAAHELVPNWYYDTMTNSILNGGMTTADIDATQIPWEELKSIIVTGLSRE